MGSINNSVDTVNAAATAIVSAEARVQPTTPPKRRWGSCWSLYWCFGIGSQKNNKRIGHAVLVPEPAVPGAVAPAVEHRTPSTTMVLPFIAPPSSPASFLQSGPTSNTQSPAGLLSLTALSVNNYSPNGPASIFAIGPYAYDTQLVSPPVFSAFTTEPSTAPITPPPESVQLTTPSSPEVPFAKLLTSSLSHTNKSFGTNQKFTLSHCDFQPYQPYPGSPGAHLISPGSVISNSGTSSPFPDKHPILEFRMADAPKLLGLEHFTTRKWISRMGSGSLTPDGTGLGSRLGSGTLTPDGMGMGSRLGSGSVTPNGVRQDSRLGSGTLTPDGLGHGLQDSPLLDNQISEVASLANSETGCQNDVTNHRVSFELTGEDVARCLANKSLTSIRTESESPKQTSTSNQNENKELSREAETCEFFDIKTSMAPEKTPGEDDQCYQNQRAVTLGSFKEFNFDQTKGEVHNTASIGAEWWANEKVGVKEASPGNNWTFFPLLQPGVS
ncbi:hypothetical protein IC582_013146 [Cucumis melo]|uniref:Uncharacterized protein LOC103484098 n=2 Tax=Cucumis melo TaxID=3656 RepID=A0A1S3AYC5_CUCME|nr:uncharacterized protein LOC103484098 [Cucumis melo]KAA0033677.1 Hydroxyproline-rich glycoprotein family protein isoform 1 [Cucumis melo var. makuwa]